jgi:hypothetical protein
VAETNPRARSNNEGRELTPGTRLRNNLSDQAVDGSASAATPDFSDPTGDRAAISAA